MKQERALERLSALIEALYDAAMGKTSFWPIANRIADQMGSHNGGLQIRSLFDGSAGIVSATDSCPPEVFDRYNQHFHRLDVMAHFAFAQPMGKLLRSEEIMSDTLFRQTEFYQDHCRPQDIFYSVGSVIPIGGPDRLVAGLRINRRERDGTFDSKSLHIGQILLPHIRRSLQLQQRLSKLELQQHAMAEATNALGVGVIVVSEDARVLSANSTAETILRHNDSLCIQNNRLIAKMPFSHDELLRTIRDAARASTGRSLKAGGLVRIPHVSRKPLALLVYPFTAPRNSNDSSVPAALIFIAPPNSEPSPTREALAKMYGLTSSEARLFAALLAGERLQEYADRLGLSVQTAKTQLAHIFQKTGHSRQTDLVRDALSNPVLRVSRP